MTCYWPECLQAARYVVVFGCLSQLHVMHRVVCDDHKTELETKQKKGRVYCPECHGGGKPWENLYPVEVMMAGLL